MLSPQSKTKGTANDMVITLLLVATIHILTAIVVHAAQEYTPQEECGLYLAPSSIPGAGLGMYSGSKAYGKHELISDGDIMILMWELDFNNGDDDYYNLWNEYTWAPSKSTISSLTLRTSACRLGPLRLFFSFHNDCLAHSTN